MVGLQVIAQTTNVTGTVTDATDGSPIPGVSVFVKGTTIGTVTTPDGTYRLAVPNDASAIVFSFVGMTTQEVAYTGQTTINAIMKSDAVDVDEVIVVAYGTQRREANTGSVAVIKTDQIKDVPVESVDKAIAGKIAGVQINSTTGQPGAATDIRIRGNGSINAGKEPLIVIDGVPVSSGNFSYFTSTGNILSTINPKDIESMTVLKDASAASLYGSRASNGVILITTKSGKKGQNRFSVTANFGVSKVTNDHDYRVMTADEIYTYKRDAIINSGKDPNTVEGGFFAAETLPSDIETYNWEESAFRTASMQDINFTANGGNEDTRYFISGGYFNQEGIMTATSLERYSFRSNIDKDFNEKFSIGLKTQGSYVYQKDRPNESMYYVNPFWASQNLMPWDLPYVDADGNPTSRNTGVYNFDLPSNNNSNHLAAAEYDDQWSKQYRFIGALSLKYEPIKDLVFRTTNSMDMLFEEGRRFWSPYSGPPGEELGTLQVSNGRMQRLNSSNIVSYSKIFAEKHRASAMAGYEAMHYKYQNHYASGEQVGAVIPYLSNATGENSTVDYAYSEYTLLSYLGTLEYSYDDRYFVKGSFRKDGNSKFGADTRWGTFWSVGASWNLHNEAFINDVPWINMLKLRGSYGVAGNDAIGIYDQYGTYASGEYNGKTILGPENLTNPNLGWEMSATTNIGLDFAFFNKVDGTIEVYNKKTTDMLLDVPISRTAGFASLRQNIGEMTNKGIEVSLNYRAVSMRDLKVDVFGTLAHNNTTIDDLGGEEEIGDGWWRRHRVGGDFSNYYVYDWAGVNPSNGLGMWYTEDGSMTYDYGSARRVYKGKVEPDIEGGFGFNVSYKGFYLNTQFRYMLGQSVYVMESRYTNSDGYNWSSNQSANLLDYWKKPGDVTGTPKPLMNNSTGSNEWGTSRFLYKGDFVRLQNLTFGYNLPKIVLDKIGVSAAKLYVSGNNLYSWHDVPYYDPERSSTGGGYIIYPQTRNFTFGLEVGF
ncbi:TonB-dependent receptor [Carboxylicivirga sediminis]|uniref:TonB-dependent receptor n=1 Tax=Carboxylicivirga sediminis TaxID=2006564 RepID=A0A941F7V4_9BACT|nr:TonB-dependent receptor [Carboxylicivirga sediminis]MBR8537205.1 TonB-dependent receptor [Carboxylicivirga sediminis]